ncbi:MAG TPA: hypothetical protein DEO73_17270 [Pantoea sp.]|nr:hypothetical protein [Pantoea sp.]
MTVSSTQSYIEYSGDGTTNSFPIPFYFLLNSDIGALISDDSGTVNELVNGVNFSVTGGGDENGGTLKSSIAYPIGTSIFIYRNPPATQESKYYENGKFPAISHEAALDKLTMLIQECGWKFDALSLNKPSIFARYFDANGNRISNISDPKDPGDAVNLSYISELEQGAKSYADQLIAKEHEERVSADKAESKARSEADANIQAQLSGSAPLSASAFSPISWHDQTISTSVNIPANKNAWSFGPEIKISPGQVVTIGAESFWTIANGKEVNQ